METITLPYVYDFPAIADYCKAVRPLMRHWQAFHAVSEWRSPAEQHRWCWAQPYAKDI